MSSSPIAKRIHLVLGQALLVLFAAAAAPADAQPPDFDKVFVPDVIGPGSISTLTFTITEVSASTVVDLDFTDVLPAGVTIADPANASTDCTFAAMGAGLSAPDSGSTITFADGQLGASQSCTVSVDVTSSTPGTHMNTTGDLTSSAGNSGTASDDLTVDTSLPGFSKSFAPSSVPLGARSTLTFLIDNTVNASDVDNLSFTDNLPAGMVIADPANASTTCGTVAIPPTLTADAGTSVVVLNAPGNSDFPAVGAGTICTVAVDVVATVAGELDNVSLNLEADFVEAGKASATLVSTATELGLRKSFLDDPVPPGATVTLEFRIDNRNRDFTATGIGFTDDLDFTPSTGITLAGGPTPDPPCGAGSTLTLAAGDVLTLAGGTLAPGAFCTFTVTLGVPVTETTGGHVNTTSAVTGTIDGGGVVGNMASETLFVATTPIFTKEFIDDPVGAGGSVTLEFTIANTDPSSTLTDIEFTDDLETAIPGLAANSLVDMGMPDPLVDPCGSGSELTVASFTIGPSTFVFPTLLEFTGGSLAEAGMPGDSCTFSVVLDVPVVPGGIYTNTTSELTGDQGATPIARDPTSGDLIVVGAPRLTKDFTDDPVEPGDQVTLEFTLLHGVGAPGDATGISFTDDLTTTTVAGLAAAAGELPRTDVCGPGNGTLTGSAGDTLLTFSSGTLTPGEECVFSLLLDVPAGASGGIFTNETSGVGATVDGLATTSREAQADLVIAQLAFSKEFTDDPALPGGSVTLEFTLVNLAPSAVTDIEFTDDLGTVIAGLLPAAGEIPQSDPCGPGSALVSFDPPGPSGPDPSILHLTGGTLAAAGVPGDACTISVVLDVPGGAGDGTFPNLTSNLSATVGSTPTTLPPASDQLTVDSERLTLTKAFTDDPVNPGGSVNLRFTLTNLDAAQAASAIAFSDNLDAALAGLAASVLPPAGTACNGTVSQTPPGLLDFSGGSLAAGASCFFDVTVGVPGGAAPGSYLNTTSGVTGTIGGLAVSGGAASDSLKVVSLLAFSKSFDGPTTATGTPVLTFTIVNPTAGTVADLSFSDDLAGVIPGLAATSLPASPCGAGSSITGTSLLTLTGGTLPPSGGTCSFAVPLLVPGTATAGTYPNETSELFQAGLPVADPATADLVVEPPPTFAKAFGPNPIFATGVSTLTFTIDNTASAVAASSLDFTDALPAGLVVATPSNASTDCTGGMLTATPGTGVFSYTGGTVSAMASCTVSVDVTSPTDGMFANVSGDLTSSSGNSGTASDTLIVGPAVDLAVTKDDGVTAATPGESVTYTIVVTNNGPSNEPSATFTDAFPSPPLTCTWTSVAAGGAAGNTAAGAGDLAETLSLPAGSSVTYTVTCAIAPDATGTLSNTATVAASVTELVPGNDSATDDDTVLVPEADLGITKTDSEDPVTAGGSLSYTVTVTNGGPSDATGVTVTETLPAGVTFASTSGCGNDPDGVPSCDLGTIAPGASKQYTVDVTVDASTPSGTITNTVSVASDAADPEPGNDTASEDTEVDDAPPTVTGVDSLPATGGGLAECEEARVAITQLRVTFSEPVQDPAGNGGADDVTNAANYLLVAAGPDNDFTTTACGGALGDDVAVAIAGVTYDGGSQTATLALGAPLGDSLHRLLVCGSSSIRDVAGNPLDGDADGTGGDDFVRTFRVELDNLLANGHFDCDLAGWVPVSTVPEEIEHGVADVDGSSVSGSAEITNLSASQSFALGQCAPVVRGSACLFSARARVEAAPAVLLTVTNRCEYYPLPACAGARLGLGASVAFVMGDTGGAWEELVLSTRSPAAAASALCSLDLRTATGEDFDADVDDASLTCTGVIFSDGFESGDVSAWSLKVP